MIESLTPAQTARMDEFVQKWVKIGCSTNEVSLDVCKDIINNVYKNGGLEPPKIVLGPYNNPFDAAIAHSMLNLYNNEFEKRSKKGLTNKKLDKDIAKIEQQLKNELISNQKSNPDIKIFDEDVWQSWDRGLISSGLNNYYSAQIYGYNDASWLSFYDYFDQVVGIDCSLLHPLMELSKNCGWWTPLQDVAIIQHRPESIMFDNTGRLHNENGPAIRFRGSNRRCDVFAVHGVRVAKRIIDRDYSLVDIEKESNAEVRRVMIDLYGRDKYILDSGAKMIHEDGHGINLRRLYRKDLSGDVPLVMLRLINSSPEKDGTYKEYWLRVDPNAYNGDAGTNVNAAVASTFRENGRLLFEDWRDYSPEVET